MRTSTSHLIDCLEHLRRVIKQMPTYGFELHFTGPAGGDALINALYEAGWDDATVSFDAGKGGDGHAAFDRVAPSALDAIVSAVEQGQACGLDVTRRQ